MNEYNLKCWPEFFDAVACGDKTFEVRKYDRAYTKGDILVLHKYDPERGYIAVPPVRRVVTFVLNGGRFGIASEFVVLGLGIEQAEAADCPAAIQELEIDDRYDRDEDDWPQCPTCRGSGRVNPLTAPPGLVCFASTDCPTCDGTGECP